jgi:hypothetical protein
MTMPTGTGQQSDPAQPQQSGTGEPQAPTGTTAEPTPSGQQSGTTPEPAQQSSQDLEALKQKLSLSDRRAQQAEEKLRELERAQLSEADRIKADLEAAKAERAKLEADLRNEKINNAFLTDNTYDWHDPRAALRLADLSGVEIKDNGTVTGLKEAIKAVADANPWMLKPAATDDGKGGTGKPGVTGVAGSSTNNSTNADRAGLEKRFPQLRGRVST